MSIRHRRRSRRLGMTLVEVLIVIGIIATLSGLLFVVGGQVKEKAREVKCRSHLSQLALAVKRYRLDHVGGRFPPGGGVNDEDWLPAILPYLDSKNILVCPNDWHLADSPDGKVDEHGSHRTTSYDYLLRFLRANGVWYSILWVEVFKKRGEATPLLRCPYHDRELFVRVNGEIGNAPKVSDWTQW